MGNDDNNDSNLYVEGLDKLSDSFDIMKDDFNGIKGSLTDLSKNMALNDKEKEGMGNVGDFVEHLNSCDNDNCDIHKAKNTHGNNMYMRGFLLGAKFGKQKRR